MPKDSGRSEVYPPAQGILSSIRQWLDDNPEGTGGEYGHAAGNLQKNRKLG